jgi:hypothetical protein
VPAIKPSINSGVGVGGRSVFATPGACVIAHFSPNSIPLPTADALIEVDLSGRNFRITKRRIVIYLGGFKRRLGVYGPSLFKPSRRRSYVYGLKGGFELEAEHIGGYRSGEIPGSADRILRAGLLLHWLGHGQMAMGAETVLVHQ